MTKIIPMPLLAIAAVLGRLVAACLSLSFWLISVAASVSLSFQ